MIQKKESLLDSIGERTAVAFVSAVLAAVTLFLYPLALSFVESSSGSGGGNVLGLFGSYYQFLFSKVGLFVIIGVAVSAFFIGPDRMASVFSFFWGTHEFWPRLEEKLNEWRDEHFSEGWLLIVLMAIFGIVVLVQFA